ncbi:hypothetical protein T265_03144, partial [Opisthorchis viverrini]
AEVGFEPRSEFVQRAVTKLVAGLKSTEHETL